MHNKSYYLQFSMACASDLVFFPLFCFFGINLCFAVFISIKSFTKYKSHSLNTISFHYVPPTKSFSPFLLFEPPQNSFTINDPSYSCFFPFLFPDHLFQIIQPPIQSSFRWLISLFYSQTYPQYYPFVRQFCHFNQSFCSFVLLSKVSFVYLPVCLRICVPVRLSSFLCLSVFIRPCPRLSVRMYVCWSVCLFICVYPSLSLFVCPYVRLQFTVFLLYGR